MSYIDRREETRPATGEAPLKLFETFYSRTDERGVIQAGNYIFRRVAGYDWDEMIGAPHKLIRHPDMPKGVFWLLWDTIKRGEPIGAYVKNRAKDGLYYWVFATVLPTGSGYLSVRMKPSSAVFDLVQKEYATLREAENTEGLSPEDSARRLLARIRELGFDSYNLFMSRAISEEMIARDKGLGDAPDPKIAHLRKMFDVSQDLEGETASLIEDFGRTKTMPTNMRVIASRLEPTGGPVSTLSKNYSMMSQEISDWFETNIVGPESNFAHIKTSISDALFFAGMTRLIWQCSEQLNIERRRLGDLELSEERRLLNTLSEQYIAKSRHMLGHVQDEARRIITSSVKMNRLVLGLSTTRVMAKIEGARLAEGGDSLTDIISQLSLFQDRIKTRLDRIVHLSGVILDNIAQS